MTRGTRIPPQDLQFQFVRAAGPGGQNVNKVASAVQLRFDLLGTRCLSERAKARLRVLAGSRLTLDGAVLIAARNHRTQVANRREALLRLSELVERASIEPKRRVATRPTAGSRRERLEGKRRRQHVKQLRHPVGEE
ncbi:MAG TPA: alternative ribosome rescue aminoacyl-tRNA hydrolase ArfB [Steroidobacteraceae bacterium]|jgi:ribosome-associated protein|nr:alternative ribosome rescue aminoacyl-tRNA hydrolase ArfB [Steroidobacteraceae bacterium]